VSSDRQKNEKILKSTLMDFRKKTSLAHSFLICKQNSLKIDSFDSELNTLSESYISCL